MVRQLPPPTHLVASISIFFLLWGCFRTGNPSLESAGAAEAPACLSSFLLYYVAHADKRHRPRAGDLRKDPIPLIDGLDVGFDLPQLD